MHVPTRHTLQHTTSHTNSFTYPKTDSPTHSQTHSGALYEFIHQLSTHCNTLHFTSTHLQTHSGALEEFIHHTLQHTRHTLQHTASYTNVFTCLKLIPQLTHQLTDELAHELPHEFSTDIQLRVSLTYAQLIPQLTHSLTHSLCTLRTHSRTRAGMQVSRSYILNLFPNSQLTLFVTNSITNSAQGCKCAASYTYNGAEMKGCIPAGEWVMSQICIESWYTHEWAMEHMRLSHGVHMNESWHAQYIIHLQCRDQGLHCCRRVSHVTYMNESWHTYEWVMARIIYHTSTMVPR